MQLSNDEALNFDNNLATDIVRSTQKLAALTTTELDKNHFKHFQLDTLLNTNVLGPLVVIGRRHTPNACPRKFNDYPHFTGHLVTREFSLDPNLTLEESLNCLSAFNVALK